MEKKTITLEITKQEFDLLSSLGKPEDVLATLADHAAQGIRRPGAWEAGWIRQCFGYEFESNLEIDPVCEGQNWTNFRTKGTPGQTRAQLRGETE